jgi:hypothetical protein
MIRQKNPKIGRWKKNERSKPRSCPKATLDILMAKYRDGKAGIKSRGNRTIWFLWIRSILLRQEAHPATNLGHYRVEVKKVGIVINRSIIQCLTSRSGHQCLGYGGLR